MVIAIDPLEEFDFVTQAERELPTEEQTIWKIVGLDIRQRTRLEDQAATAGVSDDGEMQGVKFHRAEQDYLAVRAGLKGVDNFGDGKGREVKFEQEKKMLNILGKNTLPPCDEFLSRIPAGVLAEIADAIRKNLRLTPTEGNG